MRKTINSSFMYELCSARVLKYTLLKKKIDIEYFFVLLFQSMGDVFYNPSKETSEFNKNVLEKYRGDGLLFEWGCYVIFKIECWAREELDKEKISGEAMMKSLTYLNSSLICAFAEAFKKDEAFILDIWLERKEYFSKLYSALSTQETYHWVIVGRTCISENGKCPDHLDEENDYPPIGSLESFKLKSSFIVWEAVVLPGLLDHLRKIMALKTVS